MDPNNSLPTVFAVHNNSSTNNIQTDVNSNTPPTHVHNVPIVSQSQTQTSTQSINSSFQISNFSTNSPHPYVNNNTIDLSTTATNDNHQTPYVGRSVAVENENTSGSQSTLPTYHRIQPTQDLEVLYHELEMNYIMKEYCLPIADSFYAKQDVCKFNRECLVNRKNILTKGTLIQSLAPTVFRCVPTMSKNLIYSIHDVRMLKCSNPTCKNPTTKQSKVFHNVCFHHMLGKKLVEKMDKIKLTSSSDKVIDLFKKSCDVSCLKHLSTEELKHLHFPFCRKHCYNTINNYRNKKSSKGEGDSEYATTQSWDKDGSYNTKTSMEVLINWFTTEENCSSYFGGINGQGRTNANQKDMYHYLLRDLICNENGM